MLKANFHIHTKEDPEDWISYSEYRLIDRAAKLGYKVMSITCHNKVVFSEKLALYARQKGILLIPGIEKSILGKHVLIINADKKAEKIQDFDDLAHYKKNRDCVTIAAHPLHPDKSICLGKKLLLEKIDLFDAIEYSYYHHKHVNFNKEAEEIAKKHKKTLIGNADCHLLKYLNTTYSLIDAQPNLASVLEALRTPGKVKIKSNPLTTWDMVFIPGWLMLKYYLKKACKKLLKCS